MVFVPENEMIKAVDERLKNLTVMQRVLLAIDVTKEDVMRSLGMLPKRSLDFEPLDMRGNVTYGIGGDIADEDIEELRRKIFSKQ